MTSHAAPSVARRVVHIYATMRLPVRVDDSISNEDAIAKAEQRTDLDRELGGGEWADEISCFLVDELDARGEIVGERLYDRDGQLFPRFLDPVGALPLMAKTLMSIAGGECSLAQARSVASAALPNVEIAKAKTAGAEEQLVVVASLSHVTATESSLLGSVGSMGAHVDVSSTRFGFLVGLAQWLEKEEEIGEVIAAIRAAGFSDSFAALWTGLRSRGYHWMHLDRDGDVLDGFETFSW